MTDRYLKEGLTDPYKNPRYMVLPPQLIETTAATAYSSRTVLECYADRNW